jgi:hypothetical protein
MFSSAFCCPPKFDISFLSILDRGKIQAYSILSVNIRSLIAPAKNLKTPWEKLQWVQDRKARRHLSNVNIGNIRLLK